MMLRPVALLISAIVVAILIVHVESCFRCESGVVESHYCGKGKAMATCFNEDRLINFQQPFASRPVVVVDITGYHYGPEANGRMVAKPRKKSNTGFILRMQTWENTHFYFMNISYMACGLDEA